EPASPVRDVSEGEACPTESAFIPDQDRATIAKSSTLPHDLAPRVTSLAADEGSMQHTIFELTALCTSLVKVLEDREDVVATQSGDDAPIKGRSINEGKAAVERISNDSEEIVRVLTSMDATTILAGGIDVPTSSGSIPTAGPPATVISTGSESQQRRPMAKKQKREYYMAMIRNNLGWRIKDFKDLLKQLDREDLNQLWALVKEYLSIRPATSDKEMDLWVELKKMYEPDPEDQL
nr:hypothetical protein [Tanacetum cinerariifolium]